MLALRQQRLVTHEVRDVFASSHEMRPAVVDNYLARARTRVVVRAHHVSVCARRADGEEVAGREREMPSVREKIAALAYLADDFPIMHAAGGKYSGSLMPHALHARTRTAAK